MVQRAVERLGDLEVLFQYDKQGDTVEFIQIDEVSSHGEEVDLPVDTESKIIDFLIGGLHGNS